MLRQAKTVKFYIDASFPEGADLEIEPAVRRILQFTGMEFVGSETHEHDAAVNIKIKGKAVKPLISILKNESFFLKVKEAAADSLGDIKDPWAIAPLSAWTRLNGKSGGQKTKKNRPNDFLFFFKAAFFLFLIKNLFYYCFNFRFQLRNFLLNHIPNNSLINTESKFLSSIRN